MSTHHNTDKTDSPSHVARDDQTPTRLFSVPLNKLVPSKSNVRRTHSGAGIEQLAASIVSHGMLQDPTVRAVRDSAGNDTGKFEVLAGGRRLAALKLLAKRKQIAKDAPIDCKLREDGIAEELSLAENVERENLHPADEFEAFWELHTEQGLGADDIATRFGVTARVVKERLKLGAVSPKLLALYRKGEMTLEQIMAFTVCDDHARQEQVWEDLAWNNSADAIRRTLLKAHVPANDRRALFVGIDAYQAAGGAIVRDLFTDDDGGHLSDVALLDRLAREKLEQAEEAIRAEGWKWIEIAADFPHGHGLKRLYPRDVDLPEGEAQRLNAIELELDEIEAAMEGAEENDPQAEARAQSLKDEYDRIEAKSRVFEPADIARSGAFLTIGHDGTAEVVRGFVKPEDDQQEMDGETDPAEDATGDAPNSGADADQANGLSDRLIANLTAHRTAALRDALAQSSETALLALVHALALQTFYMDAKSHSCLEISVRSASLLTFAPEIGESVATRQIGVRHEAWASRLPRDEMDLWSFVRSLPHDDRLMLLAHCVSLSVNAVETRGPARAVDGPSGAIAAAVALDMHQYWAPTAESYFGRVTKPLILEAIREGATSDAANRIADLKKADMATAAETLLQASGWLPVLLRSADPDSHQPEALTELRNEAAE